ncbi:hypothetical protein N9C62_10055 [Luminiphilus sp.]|nr:hypothetical protein [Luminiphilus sp.]
MKFKVLERRSFKALVRIQLFGTPGLFFFVPLRHFLVLPLLVMNNAWNGA